LSLGPVPIGLIDAWLQPDLGQRRPTPAGGSGRSRTRLFHARYRGFRVREVWQRRGRSRSRGRRRACCGRPWRLRSPSQRRNEFGLRTRRWLRQFGCPLRDGRARPHPRPCARFPRWFGRGHVLWPIIGRKSIEPEAIARG